MTTGWGADDGMAAIAARFSIGAAVGEGSNTGALAVAGMARPRVMRAVSAFNLPPALLTATTVGSFLDVPMQFGPRLGWYWDITALSAYGFTAGAIAVTKNAPFITPAGNPYAIEPEGSFTQQGVISFSQKGVPLLDGSERLVFTVTAALTGFAQISGMVIAVPAERLDEYLS